MPKTLVIVESPSKGRTIQKYLGDDYIVLASYGHIADLAKGGKHGLGVDIDRKFKPKYVMLEDKVKVVQDLIEAAEKADKILLFSDRDLEGESIAWHIKQRLALLNKPIARITAGEITKKGIEQAINSPREIDLKLFKAQEARRILDRIVGFMVSPFLINCYGNGETLSAGRVQSVAVRMVVDREREIETFKPEEYWNISGQFSFNGQKFAAKLADKLPTEKKAAEAIKRIESVNDFVIAKIRAQKKSEKPFPPLTTAKLQQNAAKRFSMPPDRVMQIAQSLYENGYLTYIRTDSTRVSDDAIKSARKWLKDNAFDLPKFGSIYAAKDTAQDAHECVRPTSVFAHPDSSLLAGEEQSVYRMVWQYFVASQMNPAIWNTLSIEMTSKSDPSLIFKVSGKALEYKGYLEIFGGADLSKIDLPSLQKGDKISLLATSKEQKFTQPPPRYNEASINEELETKQIGRPSTFAEIINKITSRNYVEKKGATYRPTELGRKITDILVKLFPFMDYGYTKDLEQKLDDIALGKLDQVQMLNEFFFPFKEQLNSAYIANGSDICRCGSPMVIRTNSKTGQKFLACSNYSCRTTKALN